MWGIYLQIKWMGICKQRKSFSVRKSLKSLKKDSFISNATSSLHGSLCLKWPKPVINQIYPRKILNLAGSVILYSVFIAVTGYYKTRNQSSCPCHPKWRLVKTRISGIIESFSCQHNMITRGNFYNKNCTNISTFK